jgi:hypothetical protein
MVVIVQCVILLLKLREIPPGGFLLPQNMTSQIQMLLPINVVFRSPTMPIVGNATLGRIHDLVVAMEHPPP